MFYRHVNQQLEATEDCLRKGQVIACLCLFYTLIDVVASLERAPDEGVGKAFVRWVEQNMLKVHHLPCSAIDLYAARCGVLHTFTPDSDLSRKGAARRVAYAWGHSTAEDLAEAGRRLGRDEVAVHIRELIVCLQAGLNSYLDELLRSPERLKNVEGRASMWFSALGHETVRRFLEISE
jgi:hypothetical protein